MWVYLQALTSRNAFEWRVKCWRRKEAKKESTAERDKFLMRVDLPVLRFHSQHHPQQEWFVFAIVATHSVSVYGIDFQSHGLISSGSLICSRALLWSHEIQYEFNIAINSPMDWWVYLCNPLSFLYHYYPIVKSLSCWRVPLYCQTMSINISLEE